MILGIEPGSHTCQTSTGPPSDGHSSLLSFSFFLYSHTKSYRLPVRMGLEFIQQPRLTLNLRSSCLRIMSSWGYRPFLPGSPCCAFKNDSRNPRRAKWHVKKSDNIPPTFMWPWHNHLFIDCPWLLVYYSTECWQRPVFCKPGPL